MRHIDIHMIQGFSACVLNRQDNGMPKTCTFGNTVRARVSSQCWDYWIRKDVIERVGEELMGVRLRPVADVSKHLQKTIGMSPEDAAVVAKRAITMAIVNDKKAMDKVFKGKKNKKGKVTEDQLPDDVADDVVADEETNEEISEDSGEENKEKKTDFEKETGEPVRIFSRKSYNDFLSLVEKHATDILKMDSPSLKDELPIRFNQVLMPRNKALDMAWKGRMMAENPAFNTRSAVASAHAISVVADAAEYDYFTATDDTNSNGAGHIDQLDFTTPVFYRYHNFDLEQFKTNQEGDVSAAQEALRQHLISLFQVVPQGKRSGYANASRPSVIIAVYRENGQPCSFSDAFYKPIRKEDVLTEAANRLVAEYASVERTDYYPSKAFYVSKLDGFKFDSAQDLQKNADLIEKLVSLIK